MRFLTEEAAEYLGGLNSRTVTRWAREGYLPSYPIGEGKRRLWRFLESDLEDWMLSRRTGHATIDIEACADTLSFYYRCSDRRIYPMIGTPRFQHGSLTRVKNKSTDDTWFFRFYEEVQGQRVYRKQRIGTVREFPLRRDAEKAVLSLRAKINAEVRSPDTVDDLVAHYRKYELTLERKAFATVEGHESYLDLHILPGAERQQTL